MGHDIGPGKKDVQTTLRPDIVMWSKEAKKIILFRVTVPREEGCEHIFER